MRNLDLCSTFICATLLMSSSLVATAQTNPYPIRSKPQPSLSKAGASTPRPTVPRRTVAPPVYPQSPYYYGRYRWFDLPNAMPGAWKPETSDGDRRLDSYQYEESSSDKSFEPYENSY